MSEDKDAGNFEPRKNQDNIIDYIIFGTPMVVLGAGWCIFEISGALQPLMLTAYSANINWAAKTLHPNVSFLLPLLIVFLAYFAMAGFAYSVKMKTKNGALKEDVRKIEFWREAAAQSRTAESRARAEVAGITLATDQIVNRLYSIDRPRWKYTKVIGKYVVSADGSAEVEMLYEIEAGPEPAHIWHFSIDADESAQPIEWLDEVNLKVESLDQIEGKDVRYLPFRVTPKLKKIAIFFLPEIHQGDRRKVKITYKWPGLAADLIHRKRTVFEHRFATCDPTDRAEVSYTYLFSSEIGMIDIHALTNLTQQDKLEEIAQPSINMMGWCYSNPSLSMDGRKIAFAVTR